MDEVIKEMVEALESENQIMLHNHNGLQMEIHDGEYYIGGDQYAWVTDNGVGFDTAYDAIFYAIHELGGFEKINGYTTDL